jgi:hypothetical protein
MIISASRRTDIPAFYTEWFMNRVRAGYCTIPNPFNIRHVSHVSLDPPDVDVIVFWTRSPGPLLPHLRELDKLGYRYYFQYTVMGNPRLLDPHVPSLEQALRTFRALAGRVGPDRVIWRYDPIVLSNITSPEYHIRRFSRIAQALKGHTSRVVVSLMDKYRKNRGRLMELEKQGVVFQEPAEIPLAALLEALVNAADQCGMEITSCAEEIDLQPYGIQPGKCVDDAWIRKLFGVMVSNKKDPAQRKACDCVISKDIGMYDTCLFGCQYCYATAGLSRVQAHRAQHDPRSPSLVGWYDGLSTNESPRQRHP